PSGQRITQFGRYLFPVRPDAPAAYHVPAPGETVEFFLILPPSYIQWIPKAVGDRGSQYFRQVLFIAFNLILHLPYKFITRLNTAFCLVANFYEQRLLPLPFRNARRGIVFAYAIHRN